MTPTDPRLRAVLDAAMNQIASTVTEAADRLPESLALAQSGARGAEREVLVAAQIELRRNMESFRLAFAEDLRDRHAFAALDLDVKIEKRAMQLFPKQSTDRRLSGAGQAHQNEVGLTGIDRRDGS